MKGPSFGETLQAAREFRELTKADLARKMERKTSWGGYIGSIETETLQPNVALLVEFATALDVDFVCRPDGWSFRPTKNGQ